MDAEGARAIGGLAQEFGEAGDGAKERVKGRGDGGGEIRTDAVASEEGADVVERGVGRFHHVVAAAAVDVDVKERGDQRAVREVDVAPGGKLSGRTGGDADDALVFEDDDGVVVELGGGEQTLRCEDRAHEETGYRERVAGYRAQGTELRAQGTELSAQGTEYREQRTGNEGWARIAGANRDRRASKV